MIVVVLGGWGLALAENAADEAAVNSGTMDLETVIEGSVYTSDQSVTGTGLARVYDSLVVLDPDDGSNVLDLKTLSSGTGVYSRDSYVYVQNNTKMAEDGEFEDENHNITLADDITAVYSPVSLKFPGSFKATAIKALWMDKNCAKNYAGMISMDSAFDYAKRLHKESVITMYSEDHNYHEFIETANSSMGSRMGLTSNFDGSAHLGVSLADVKGGMDGSDKSRAENTAILDEDYRGAFNLTKKMAVDMVKTTDYGYYEKNYEDLYEVALLDDYPWLPCACNAGWDDLAIHDQRYHSAKGFFDCTTCGISGNCRN